VNWNGIFTALVLVVMALGETGYGEPQPVDAEQVAPGV